MGRRGAGVQANLKIYFNIVSNMSQLPGILLVGTGAGGFNLLADQMFLALYHSPRQLLMVSLTTQKTNANVFTPKG